jgi:glycosyltransferase involved in cell wall biosynthesis
MNLQGRINMEAEVLTTIIITTHDRPRLLLRSLNALKSVLGTGKVEVIVVDDGSVPIDPGLVEFFAPGFSYFRRLDKPSLPRSRNWGLAFCRGVYVVFCDDDDFLETAWVEFVCSKAKERSRSVYLGNFYRQIEQRDDVLIPVSVTKTRHVQTLEQLQNLHIGNTFPVGSYAVPADVACRVRFDETFQTHEDWDFLLEIRKELDFQLVSIDTCTITQSATEKQNMLAMTSRFHGIDHLLIYRKHGATDESTVRLRRDRLRKYGISM